MGNLKLREAPCSAKLMVALFLMTAALGYLAAISKVYSNTHFKYSEIVAEMRGNEAEEVYAPDFGEMLTTTHTHLFGHASLFFGLCVIFLFTSAADWFKSLFILAGFGGILLDQIGMWLTRYVWQGFASFVLIGGMIMGISFLVYLVIPFCDILIKQKKGGC